MINQIHKNCQLKINFHAFEIVIVLDLRLVAILYFYIHRGGYLAWKADA
jgi:hypothetical protein